MAEDVIEKAVEIKETINDVATSDEVAVIKDAVNDAPSGEKMSTFVSVSIMVLSVIGIYQLVSWVKKLIVKIKKKRADKKAEKEFITTDDVIDQIDDGTEEVAIDDETAEPAKKASKKK